MHRACIRLSPPLRSERVESAPKRRVVGVFLSGSLGCCWSGCPGSVWGRSGAVEGVLGVGLGTWVRGSSLIVLPSAALGLIWPWYHDGRMNTEREIRRTASSRRLGSHMHRLSGGTWLYSRPAHRDVVSSTTRSSAHIQGHFERITHLVKLRFDLLASGIACEAKSLVVAQDSGQARDRRREWFPPF